MAKGKKIELKFEVEAQKSDNFQKNFEKFLENLTPEQKQKILSEALVDRFLEREVPEEEESDFEEFEYEELSGDGIDRPILKFKIGRKQKELVSKTKTALWEIEDLFMDEQKARSNSSFTLDFYRRCFKKFYEACAFMYEEGNEDFINDLYNNCPDYEKSPLAYAGKMFPMAVLEDIDLQKNFVEYLTDVCEVNMQTVNSYLRGLKAIMKYCAEMGWIDDRKFVINEKEPEIKQTYTDTELKKLLRKPPISATNFVQYRNWVIINHLLSTGNRVQTIRNIKVKDLDLDEGYLRVQVQKSGKTTRIPLPKKYIRVLREYITIVHTSPYTQKVDGDRWLFPNEYGEQITSEGLKKSIANYNKSRGVAKTSCHLFRHTFAKNWIISGGDIVSLQKILGHSTVKMAQRYANLYAEDIKPKIEKHSTLTKMKQNSGRTIQLNLPENLK